MSEGEGVWACPGSCCSEPDRDYTEGKGHCLNSPCVSYFIFLYNLLLNVAVRQRFSYIKVSDIPVSLLMQNDKMKLLLLLVLMVHHQDKKVHRCLPISNPKV